MSAAYGTEDVLRELRRVGVVALRADPAQPVATALPTRVSKKQIRLVPALALLAASLPPEMRLHVALFPDKGIVFVARSADADPPKRSYLLRLYRHEVSRAH